MAPYAYHPASVLLVEDSDDDAALALRALRNCAHPLAVRVARDGFQARRALGLGDGLPREGRRLPDLVISDLKLPALDGAALLRLVREDDGLATLPFIVYSSSDESSDVARCLSLGADGYLAKPVGFLPFLECLRSVADWALDGRRTADAPPGLVTPRPRPAPSEAGVRA